MRNNKNKFNPPELLAPAGNLEKLKIAIKYGADAVYFGLPGFSLRAKASQFTKSEIREGVNFCREMGKKFYVALNIYAHNIHIDNLDKQLDFIKEIKPDGIILSDPGILRQVKKKLSEIDIHLSTQANATNKEAVKFWQEQGVKRVILAREVSLKEVKEIKKAVPGMELEYFVHGAMCMAYSGRCILSKWMLGRSANLGDCAQPCRWKYHGDYNFGKFRCSTQGGPTFVSLWRGKQASVSRQSLKDEELKTTRVVDDKERFEMEVEEDQTGTYLFNSNDICLIEHLKELQEAGIDSIKIEGRNKSVYYVAMVVRAYRKMLDILKKENKKEIDKEIQKQKKELEKLSNRGYWTGFAFQDEPSHLLDKASREASDEFVGISLIKDDSAKSSEREVFVHNSFALKDKIEVITPTEIFKTEVLEIKNDKDEFEDSAHGGQNKVFKIKFNKEIKGVFIIRKSII